MILSILFSIIFALLGAEDDLANYQVQELSAHKAPNAIVHNCVNALTGRLFMIDEDGRVDAADTLSFRRIHAITKSDWTVIGSQMRFFDARFLIERKRTILMDTHRETVSHKYFMKESDGKKIATPSKKLTKESGYYLPHSQAIDFRNTSLTKKINKDDQGNIIAGEWIASHDDGSKWIFKYCGRTGRGKRHRVFLLEKKVLPNGNIVRYENEREDYRLKGIKLFDSTEEIELASLDVTYGDKTEDRWTHRVDYSNGQWTEYEIAKEDKEEILCTAYYGDGRIIGYNYRTCRWPSDPIGCPYRTLRLGKWNLYFQYYYTYAGMTPIIKRLYEYHPNSKEKKILYRFKYFGDHTDVYPSGGGKIEYGMDHFDRLKHIYNFVGKKIYNGIQYSWNDKSQLQSQWVGVPKKYALSHKQFTYDDAGNCIEEVWTGNFTGLSKSEFSVNKGNVKNPPEQVTYKYTYTNDGRNLLTSKDWGNGYSESYEYDDKRNLVTAAFQKQDGVIVDRKFTTYNSAALPIVEIHDDGSSSSPDDLTNVTFRIIKETFVNNDRNQDGFSKPKEERTYKYNPITGQKTLMTCRKFEYVNVDMLSKEIFYNSNEEYQYEKIWEYDDRRLCIRSIDAIGRETFYEYDQACNLVSKQISGLGMSHRYILDMHGRVIEEQVSTDEGDYSLYNEYNLKGNIISKIDRYGKKTTFRYDTLDRLIETTYSDGSREILEYDQLDGIIKKIDRDDNETTFVNNVFGKPIAVNYPSGATEKCVYDKWGRLVEKKEKNGTYTYFTVSPLGQVLKTETYDEKGNFLRAQSSVYKGSQLLSSTDYMGNTTYYFYDEAGFKIKEETCGRIEEFEYTDLGQVKRHTDYLSHTKALVKIYSYDSVGRTVSESTENLKGDLIEKVEYIYDLYHDQPLSVKKWTSRTDYVEMISEYTSEGLPKLLIEADGSNIQYQHFFEDCLVQMEIDGEGRETITHVDDRGLKKIIEKRNPSGVTIALEEYEYSGSGKVIAAYYHRYIEEDIVGSYTVEYTYTSFGEVESITQQPNHATPKYTRYIYNDYEQLVQIVENGTNIINYEYDALGRQSRVWSDDGTVCFENEYDILDNITKSTNCITGISFFRNYDSRNNLIGEYWSTGAHTETSFDNYNRINDINFHDDSSVLYTYIDDHVKKITRFKQNLEAYSLETRAVDLKGRAVSLTLPFGLEVSHLWSGLDRKLQTQSNIWSQDLVEFDASGLLLKESIASDGAIKDKTYNYNNNKQLIQEEGSINHTYSYDSLDNRLSKDNLDYIVNEFNQVIHDGIDSYEYDVCGNRVQKGDIEYQYNTLHRLTRVITPKYTIEYSYDIYGRRVSRTFISNDDEQTCYYLYLDQYEIGSYDEDLVFKDFRVLSPEHHQVAIVSAAVEIEGSPYGIIRDDRQNIVCLYDQNLQPVQYMDYSAFGESNNKPQSPWGFIDQRMDPDLGLLLFKMRIYDPVIGSWINPDPLYFKDGANRYAFVHNNPLSCFDPFGLLSINDRYQFKSSTSDLMRHMNDRPIVNHEKLENARIDTRFKKEKAINGSGYDSFEPKYSESYHIQGEPSDKYIHTFINGVNNNEDEFEKNMNYYQELVDGKEVYGVHNQTYGLDVDLKECLMGLVYRMITRPAKQQALLWMDLLTANPDKEIKHIAHSQGGIHTSMALTFLKYEFQQRIHVLLVNPAEYVRYGQCASVKAVIGATFYDDPISKIDKMGLSQMKGNDLARIDTGEFFSHSFTYSEYKEPIRDFLKELTAN